MEIMSNQQVSGSQRDFYQNKQILGSWQFPFRAGGAGGNERSNRSWGFLREQLPENQSCPLLVWQKAKLRLCGAGTSAHNRWQQLLWLNGTVKMWLLGEKGPSLHWLLLGRLFWIKNQGRVQEATPDKSIPFLSLFMMIINPAVVPRGEITEHYVPNQQIFCFHNLKCSVLCCSLLLLTQTLWWATDCQLVAHLKLVCVLSWATIPDT